MELLLVFHYFGDHGDARQLGKRDLLFEDEALRDLVLGRRDVLLLLHNHVEEAVVSTLGDEDVAGFVEQGVELRNVVALDPEVVVLASVGVNYILDGDAELWSKS